MNGLTPEATKRLIAELEMAAIRAESRIEAEPLINYARRGQLKGHAEAYREASDRIRGALNSD